MGGRVSVCLRQLSQFESQVKETPLLIDLAYKSHIVTSCANDRVGIDLVSGMCFETLLVERLNSTPNNLDFW